MPTKIELTLEQSQQGVSNDVLVAVSSSIRFLKPKVHKLSLEPRRDQIINLNRTQSIEDGNLARANIKQALGRRSCDLSWKPCQGDSLNLPDHRYKVGVAASF
uniref:Uncharacterized protein n=1 Tax=Tanacetum cinerariifolium TaxID=118510 RepID=A0A699HTJ9_TANCI|nr:hypothetical protein [Tanacetum cinerariifolium]